MTKCQHCGSKVTPPASLPARLEKAAACIYIAVEKPVADDIAALLREAVAAMAGDGERETWQQRACEAIEQAIVNEDGLDGLDGERLLREVGYWPAREAR